MQKNTNGQILMVGRKKMIFQIIREYEYKYMRIFEI